VSLAPDRANGEGRPGYRLIDDVPDLDQDTDFRTVKVDRMVSVTPLSLDLTSRVAFGHLHRSLRAAQTAQLPEPLPFFLDSLVDAPVSRF
jgi:hypothetical protein